VGDHVEVFGSNLPSVRFTRQAGHFIDKLENEWLRNLPPSERKIFMGRRPGCENSGRHLATNIGRNVATKTRVTSTSRYAFGFIFYAVSVQCMCTLVHENQGTSRSTDQ
jgi:hypothetical protein